jgi:hypothetical protein
VRARRPRCHPALLLLVAPSLLAVAAPAVALAPSDGAAGASSLALHAPAAGSTLSNVTRGGATEVAVGGTVGGRGLTRWTLDAGPGEAPSSWARIAEGSAQVAGGTLGVWRTGPLTNGPYILRLQAWDAAGRRREVRVPVVVANFSLRQDRLELDATGGGVVTYTSVVPFPLTETLVVKDGTGRVVRTLVDAPRPAGTHADAWDGRDDAGTHLPDGPYFVVATVTAGGHTMTWDETHEALANYFDSKDALRIEPFDPFDNRPLTVAYTSPAAGIVTISVFNKSLTTLDCDQPAEKVLCLVKGAYEEAGAHTFVWAGVDVAGGAPEDAGDGAPDPRALQQGPGGSISTTMTPEDHGIVVLESRIAKAELVRLVRLYFEDMVKIVVDVELGIAAVGGEMHADAEQLLLEHGSRQADLWGANYYPGRGPDVCIEYTSLINIRPSQGNRGMVIVDEAIRARMKAITFALIGRGEPLE